MAAREITAARILLTDAIDYAGLFPPTSLSFEQALANYAEYANSLYAWALGRFVLPAEHLPQFEAAASAYGIPWRLAVLGPTDFQHRFIQSVEQKASLPEDMRAPEHKTRQVYFEIPIDTDPTQLIGRAGEIGARAKIRLSRGTEDGIASVADVARFIDIAARSSVPFKVTAGLHHAMRGEHPLGSGSTATMHGYLNIFLAAAYAREGHPPQDLMQILDERSPDAFEFEEHSVTWRGNRLTTEHLALARQRFITCFGSCSFSEPVEEACKLRLIP